MNRVDTEPEAEPEAEPTEHQDTLALDARVIHVADEALTAPRESLQRVAELAKAKSRAIQMRVAIQLWDFKQYVSWKGQIWKIQAADEAEANEIQQAMEMFFAKVGTIGAAATMERLKDQ